MRGEVFGAPMNESWCPWGMVRKNIVKATPYPPLKINGWYLIER